MANLTDHYLTNVIHYPSVLYKSNEPVDLDTTKTQVCTMQTVAVRWSDAFLKHRHYVHTHYETNNQKQSQKV